MARRLLLPLLLGACGPPWVVGPDVPDLIEDDEACESPRWWYQDGDEDGHGNPNVRRRACEAPWGHVADGTDCDDTTSAAFPGNFEACDGIDNDCDGMVDGENAVDSPAWHADLDGDGFGSLEVVAYACERPFEGALPHGDDCDDGRPDIHPGAPDPHCDGIDQDCGGQLEVESAYVGASPFATVTEALAAAPATARVEVCPGEHAVSVVASVDALTLIGLGETPGEVVLVPDGDGRILELTGVSLRLERLTLEGGATDLDGGAAHLVAEEVSLHRVVIRGGRADGHGGGAFVRGRVIGLRDVDLRGNRAGGDGGGVYVVARDTEARLLVEGGAHEANVAGGAGGAVAIEVAGSLELEVFNTVASDHHAGDRGGWMALRSADRVSATLSSVRVEGGSAGATGGLLDAEAPRVDLDILGSSALSGASARRGGCVSVRTTTQASVYVNRSPLEDCSADQGGLAHVDGGAGEARFETYDLPLRGGAATGGAAVWLDAARSPVLWLHRAAIQQNSGGPAVLLGPEAARASGSPLVRLSTAGMWDNEGGGIDVPAGVTVDVLGSDLGGSSDSSPFDIRTDGVAFSWDGEVLVTCRDGSCE